MRSYRLLALAPLLLVTTTASANDLIISGGPIITIAGDEPSQVESVLIRDGRIAATGLLADVKKVAKGKAQSVDLNGRTMLPGFIDAHGHMTYVGQNAAMAQLQPPPVGGVTNIAEMQTALRNYKLPEGVPLTIGNGYDDSQLAERRHPTRADLDAVSATMPIKALKLHLILSVMFIQASQIKMAEWSSHICTKQLRHSISCVCLKTQQ